MKVIRRIIITNILFILLLITSAYAEYPTSTPESLEPLNFNLIEGIKDALSNIAGSASSSETVGGTEIMAGGSSASSSIPAVTWTGLGEDNLAATAANWLGDVAPKNGDGVVFNSTSKNCTWDLAVILGSFSINSGYAAKVTLEANLTISDDFIWTGMGEDTLASNPANWSRNIIPEDGYKVVFNGTSTKDCVWDIDISPSSFSMGSTYTGTITLNADLSVTGYLSIEGGFLDLNDKTLSVDGYLSIGTYGTLYGTSSTIKVKGDWINRGAFDPETSTVILNGTNQTVYGDNTFFNLIKITDLAYTLSFEAGKTQIILNNITLLGSAGNLLYIKSTAEGQQWNLDAQGTRSILFVRIQDTNSISSVNIEAANSENGGNNIHMNIIGGQCL